MLFHMQGTAISLKFHKRGLQMQNVDKELQSRYLLEGAAERKGVL